MASENKVCINCENFRLVLNEKDKKINELKAHINNLKNYILEKDSFIQSNSIEKFNFNTANEIERKDKSDYRDELLNKSSVILEDFFPLKSLQPDISGNSNNIKDPEKKEEILQSEVANLPDYVYDKNYQMYYSLSTGYYYDEKSGLMYEPQSCTYYRYNYDKKEYEKVSQEHSTDSEQVENNELKDENKISFNCEAVVNQVNNLNLNDDSIKGENCQNETENANILELQIEVNEAKIEKNNAESIICDEKNVSPCGAQEWLPTEGSNLTVTDMVKQVVEEHNNMSDYIYDETYKMYYSPSTGYFYDSVRNLLYDPTTGIYYSYDSDKQTYEFYCQTYSDASHDSKSDANKASINKEKLTCRKRYWRKKLECPKETSVNLNICDNYEKSNCEDLDEFSSPEEGEIFSSDDEVSNSPICIVKSPVKGPSVNKNKNAPSIRAIVEDSEKLRIGTLILITCSGGVIGRDKMNEVYVPDLCVSKLHAEIKFNSDVQTYSIEDLGSQNGTFINEKRLSEPKIKSEPCTLNHGDKLTLGSFKLLLHIHDEYDTCDNCEPGQVLAEISSNVDKNIVFLTKEEKEKLRREELHKLKQKYGLKGTNFQRNTNLVSEGYEDKSEIRRQTVGSDNPYEKTQKASMDISMPETNKGYKMLKKMGWKEGQTLGPTDSGLVEPIPLRPWTSKAGLGSDFASMPNTTVSLQEDKRSQRWVKAQERYFQLSLGKDASIPDQDHQDSMPT